MCDPYTQYTAETLQARSTDTSVKCSQSIGVIEQVVPLTTSTVSSSAAAGSVGGSILGALIAAILSWFLNNFGEMILKFLLGRVYTKFQARLKSWYDSRKKAADFVAGSNDDVETGAHGRELSAAATILNVTPTDPATISGVAGASNQNPVKAVKVYLSAAKNSYVLAFPTRICDPDCGARLEMAYVRFAGLGACETNS
jgi:hypothetical protein